MLLYSFVNNNNKNILNEKLSLSPIDVVISPNCLQELWALITGSFPADICPIIPQWLWPWPAPLLHEPTFHLHPSLATSCCIIPKGISCRNLFCQESVPLLSLEQLHWWGKPIIWEEWHQDVHPITILSIFCFVLLSHCMAQIKILTPYLSTFAALISPFQSITSTHPLSRMCHLFSVSFNNFNFFLLHWKI